MTLGHESTRTTSSSNRVRSVNRNSMLEMRKTGKSSYVMDIENTGHVPVEQVEVDIPPEASNWHLLTDGLASYPIPVLDPGDRQTAHVAVSMGPHASVEVTLRGLAGGEPYERRQTVSVIGV
jgi:uncharacterized membrane protein